MELFSQVLLNRLYNLPVIIDRTLVQLSCCNLCKQSVTSNPLLCDHCLADLPTLRFANNHCNLLHWPAINALFTKRKFDRLISVMPYVWPVDHWLKQIKYQHKFQLSWGLAELIAKHTEPFISQLANNECLMTCVPTDINRWQYRGYNPAHLIAKRVAKITKMSYQANLLQRIKTSDAQVGKTGAQRRKALKGAFDLISKEHLPKHILLFDDVITTGSTVNEISGLLKKHGVRHITVLTLAIALPS